MGTNFPYKSPKRPLASSHCNPAIRSLGYNPDYFAAQFSKAYDYAYYFPFTSRTGTYPNLKYPEAFFSANYSLVYLTSSNYIPPI